MEALQVLPPSFERIKNTLEPPLGSPKNGLLELLQDRYTTPPHAAAVGCVSRRVALTYLGSPVIPGLMLGPEWIVSRRFTKKRPLARSRIAPHSMNSPGCVIGRTVGFGAPTALNVAKRNVSPASSEINIWIKSWSALLKRRKGT